MTPINFDNNTKIVEQKFDDVSRKFAQRVVLTRDMHKKYKQVIEDLHQILAGDTLRTSTIEGQWYTAHRLTGYTRILEKIDKLKNTILAAPHLHSISNYPLLGVRTALLCRIHDLKQEFFKIRRLPLFEGLERRKYYVKRVSKLQLKDSAKIGAAEEEYFHLMGNHIARNQLKDINLGMYEGSYEISSLSSWVEVLRLFVEKGDPNAKCIGNKVLDILNKSKSLFLKLTFAYKILVRQERRYEALLEKQYIEDFDQAYNTNDRQASAVSKITDFLEEYNLSNHTIIPKEVIISEIVWDVLESINVLKPGEPYIIALGTKYHAILVQITCKVPGTPLNKGCYEYKIFNTGEDCENWHLLSLDKTMAYPLSYQNIPKSAFTYTFFSELYNIYFFDDSVWKFYTTQDKLLVSQNGGLRVAMIGMPYARQNLGTCSYASLEAYVNSFFTEPQIQQLEFTKAKMAVSKQEKVVNLLNTNPQTLQRSVLSKKRKANSYTDGQPKTKKLKESQILLDLGKQFLQSRSQQFANPGVT